VIVGVMLARFFGVMGRVDMMAMGHVSVMPGGMVIAGLVMLGCLAMVFGRFVVVSGGFAVMIRGGFGHGYYLRPKIQGSCDTAITGW